jgi:type II secretory pathway component GspD/PulD (secretin)
MSNRVFSSIGSVPMSLGMIVIFSLLLICGGGGSATGHDPSGNRIIGGSTNTIYGRTIDVLDYGNLVSAIKAMGTAQTTLVISTPHILTEDTTIPSNIYLVIQNGGTITKDSSYKLTI